MFGAYVVEVNELEIQNIRISITKTYVVSK